MLKNNILLFIFLLVFTFQSFSFAQQNGDEKQLQRNLEICERYFEDLYCSTY